MDVKEDGLQLKNYASVLIEPRDLGWMKKLPKLREFIVNYPICVAVWEDGTRTRSTCSKEDQFDPEIGFAVCLRKRMFPEKTFVKVLRKANVITK